MKDKAKGSKKNRKFEGNKIFCANYKRAGQREINKARKIARHLKKHPNDVQVA